MFAKYLVVCSAEKFVSSLRADIMVSCKSIMGYDLAFHLRHEVIEPSLLDSRVLKSCEAID